MRHTLTFVPINGRVYSSRDCQFLAMPTLNRIGWRKNPGAKQLEQVICTNLPDDGEVVWMNLEFYRSFWRPLRRQLAVGYEETSPNLVRNIRQSRITLAETSSNGQRI